jgi:hypothetical protein
MPHKTNLNPKRTAGATCICQSEDDIEKLHLGLYEVNQIINKILPIKKTIEETAVSLSNEIKKQNPNENDKLTLKGVMIIANLRIIRYAEEAMKHLGNKISVPLNVELNRLGDRVVNQTLQTQMDLGTDCNYERMIANLVNLGIMLTEEIGFFRVILRFQIEQALMKN